MWLLKAKKNNRQLHGNKSDLLEEDQTSSLKQLGVSISMSFCFHYKDTFLNGFQA